jgi:membrane protein DedA with SNARE-associated domain
MNVLHFGLFTTIGAGLWNSVLALLGYLAQGQQDLIEAYSHELSIAILALLAVVVIYFIIKKLCQRQKK